MGRASRLASLPERLGEKLLGIRKALNITQAEILNELNRYGDFGTLTQNIISDYEKNRREPPVLILYAYAKLANVYIDILVDDSLNLPAEFPSKTKKLG